MKRCIIKMQKRKNTVFFSPLSESKQVHKCLSHKRLELLKLGQSLHFCKWNYTCLEVYFCCSFHDTSLFIHLKNHRQNVNASKYTHTNASDILYIQCEKKEFLFEATQNLLMTFMLWSWWYSVSLIFTVFHSF